MSREIDAVISLTRIIKSSADWVQEIQSWEALQDPRRDRLDHIRANLDRIEKLLEER